MYLIASFSFFLFGGVMALMIRAELAQPGMQFFSNEQYNQLFTMHGSIMLLLFATPLFAGFANAIMPLQIGAPDVAFPRLNMLAFWFFVFGGVIVCIGFLTPGGRRPSAGSPTRRCRTRSTRRTSAPTCGSSGFTLGGLGTILGVGQLHHHDLLHARARHDDVPDADLHLERAAHQRPGAHGVPGARRGAARARGRPQVRHAWSSTPRTAARSSGSTCSGSSAIPRSTSSRCRSSASRARSSRCSAASRSSATRAWCSRRSRSRRSRSRCGPTTCTSRARSTCRSSRS